MRARHLLGVAILGGLLLACARLGDGRGGARVPIDHIVVLFLENRSFDHLFGTYPEAEGLASYRGQQTDKNAVTYARLPAPLGRDGKPDPRFPGDLPNAPFAMLRFVGPFPSPRPSAPATGGSARWSARSWRAATGRASRW